MALQKDPPDLLLAKESFIKAKNHPQDVDGMIKLFLRCYSFNKIQDPILIWVAADRNIEALKFAGQKLHQSIEAGNINKNTLLLYDVKQLMCHLDFLKNFFLVLQQMISTPPNC